MKKSLYIPLLFLILFSNLGGFTFTFTPNNLKSQFKSEETTFIENTLPMGSEGLDINAYSTNPITGNVSALGIPVYFTDRSYSYSTAYLDYLWNNETNSVRSYFQANSHGLLNISATILNWTLIDAPSTDFYGEDTVQLLRELDMFNLAVEQWDDTIDFSEYDYVYLIFAGDQSHFTGTFWPHVWFGGSADWETDDIIFDRVAFLGEKSNMGTFCHEFGHMFGLLDYYIPDSDTYPVGRWELMGSGNYNGYPSGTSPSELSLYSRLELGWVTMDEVYVLNEGEIMNMNIVPIETPYVNPDEGYYYGAIINTDGFYTYYVEYRADIGTDTWLADNGIMISRSDRSKGQYEGPFWYIGGDNTNIILDNPELHSSTTDNDDKFIHWLPGDFEMSVSVTESYGANESIPKTMEVIIDTYTDFGEDWKTIENVAAESSAIWDLPNLNENDIIYFCWDTQDEDSGSDFYIMNETSPDVFTPIYTKENIYQDSIEYRLNSSGNYRIEVYNDNPTDAMDVQYQLNIYDAPSYEIEFEMPELVYMINNTAEFEIDIELENPNMGWVDYEDVIPGSFEIEFPIDFIIEDSEGDNLNELDNPIFFNHPKEKLYTINCTTVGVYLVNVTYIDVNISTSFSKTIEIKEDFIKPTIQLDTMSNGTKFDSFLVRWIAFDNETGIDHYDFFIDGEFVDSFITSSKTVYEIPLPDVEGIYNLTVVVYDKMNNSASDSMSVFYDNTKPEITQITGNLEDGEYWVYLDIVEEFSPPVIIKIYLDNNQILEYIVTQEDFTQFEFQILDSHFDDLDLTDREAVIVQVKIYDGLENYNTYYRNFGTLMGLTSGESPDDDDNTEPRVPGYLGIGLTSLLAVFLLSKRKWQKKR